MAGAYRRSGADPPFGDPARAHGVPFEGYFWRITQPRTGVVAVALGGLFVALGLLATHRAGDPEQLPA